MIAPWNRTVCVMLSTRKNRKGRLNTCMKYRVACLLWSEGHAELVKSGVLGALVYSPAILGELHPSLT